MAYRIPLQNGRHRGHVTGWSKLMHIAPMFARPAVTKGPWTVEMVVFSSILVTLGFVCLVWTAIKPEYGSYILGGALVALGACFLGTICALRWNQEDTRAAAMAAANADARSGQGLSDNEETTMIHVDVHSANTSPSALRHPPAHRPDYQTSAATDFRSPDFRSSDFRSPDFRSPDFRSPDFRSPDFRIPDFRSECVVAPGSRPDVTSLPLNRDVVPDNDDVRHTPEGEVDQPNLGDLR